MTLDDVLGSDRDEFPLEQLRFKPRAIALEQDWDEPAQPRIVGQFETFAVQSPRQERLAA